MVVTYPQASSSMRLPWWLRVAGYACVILAGILCGRLVWEQTYLTWRFGPQMVGFSLAHGGAALLLLSPVLLVLWILVIVAAVVRALVTKRLIACSTWFDLAVSVLVIAILAVPYGAWQRLFVNRLVRGPYVGEFMTYAAATGDLSMVRALLAHGAPVDVANRSGKTGLHAAALGNRVDVLKFLVSKKATLDALDRYGDSPLEVAVSDGSMEAVRFLESQGAHQIRGTDAQRQKATKDIVREDMMRMDRSRVQ
jgi:hypothetical protein